MKYKDKYMASFVNNMHDRDKNFKNMCASYVDVFDVEQEIDDMDFMFAPDKNDIVLGQYYNDSYMEYVHAVSKKLCKRQKFKKNIISRISEDINPNDYDRGSYVVLNKGSLEYLELKYFYQWNSNIFYHMWEFEGANDVSPGVMFYKNNGRSNFLNIIISDNVDNMALVGANVVDRKHCYVQLKF